MSTRMRWVYHDGGRAAAGYKGLAGDCVTRAIAIAMEKPYAEVYTLVNAAGEQERKSRHRKTKSSASSGVYKPTTRRIIRQLGWVWHPIMGIGTGCTVHLRVGQLPPGRLIVKLSKHIAAVIDGVVYDNHDCRRNGTRCVYGYWTAPVTEKQ